MSSLPVVRPAALVEGTLPAGDLPAEGHVVSLINGVPALLDGVSPVIAVAVVDPVQDVARLLRAAEHLLPLNRAAPGIVVLDEHGHVQGVVPRPDLEEAVLSARQGDYGAVAKGLGLLGEYHPPAGYGITPFVYWHCPSCKNDRVPLEAHQGDPPASCALHDPAVPMVRRIHPGG